MAYILGIITGILLARFWPRVKRFFSMDDLDFSHNKTH